MTDKQTNIHACTQNLTTLVLGNAVYLRLWVCMMSVVSEFGRLLVACCHSDWLTWQRDLRVCLFCTAVGVTWKATRDRSLCPSGNPRLTSTSSYLWVQDKIYAIESQYFWMIWECNNSEYCIPNNTGKRQHGNLLLPLMITLYVLLMMESN